MSRNPRLRLAAAALAAGAVLLPPLRDAAAFIRGGAWSGDRQSWNYNGMRGTASGGDGSWNAHGYRGGSASGGSGSWSGTTYRGGTASGGSGSWHATGAEGGTASGGGGSWHANSAYGGSASGGDGTWHATTANGATTVNGYDHYGGSYYYGYHPPTVVNSYSTGCYNCGGWGTGAAVAAGVTGMAAGAAMGAAAASASSANAYAAGVAAGAASAPPPPAALPVAQPGYVMNDIYPTLPPGCAYSPVSGAAYYRCGATWFSPFYGANGMYYRVVPTP